MAAGKHNCEGTMRKPKPLVGVLLGSDSDLETMVACAETLEALGIEFELRIASAHRSPEKVREYVRSAAERGLEVLICAAGGAAHLGGLVAAETILPVIAVPMPSPLSGGLDSVLSMVQMPGGVPVATMAIGKAGATNAAILAAEILALGKEELRERLWQHKRSLAEGVQEKDSALREIGYREYLARKGAGKG